MLKWQALIEPMSTDLPPQDETVEETLIDPSGLAKEIIRASDSKNAAALLAWLDSHKEAPPLAKVLIARLRTLANAEIPVNPARIEARFHFPNPHREPMRPASSTREALKISDGRDNGWSYGTGFQQNTLWSGAHTEPVNQFARRGTRGK